MTKLKLHIPKQHEKQTDDFDFRPDSLTKWLQEIPEANAEVSSRKLLNVLEQLNRRYISVNDRYLIMQSFLPVINNARKAIRMVHRSAPLPLSEKARATSELLIDIHKEIAFSYKIIVLDLLRQTGTQKTSAPHLSHAIYQALNHLASFCFEHFQVYAEIPSNTWSEIHQLFLLARHHELHQMTVEYPGSTANKPTIVGAYKRILLLSAANPYHLMQGEAAKVYKLLAHWAWYAKFITTEKMSQNGGLLLDFALDAPPVYCNPQDDKTYPNSALMLDVSDLVKSAKIQMQKLKIQNETGGNSATTFSERANLSMFQRLAAAWDVPPHRKSRRDYSNNQISSMLGLSTCHKVMSNHEEFSPEEDEIGLNRNSLAQASILTLVPKEHTPWVEKAMEEDIATGVVTPRESHFDEVETDIWKKIRANKTARDAKKQENNQLKINGGESLQINTGHGGYATSLTNKSGLSVRVGELIAEQSTINEDDEEQSETNWRLGTVKWLKSNSPYKLTAGVSSLPGTAKPVAIKAISGTGEGSEYFRALILNEKQDADQHIRSLLAPAAVYDVDSVILVNLKNKLRHIRLTQLVESTALFARFRFEVTKAPDNSVPANAWV